MIPARFASGAYDRSAVGLPPARLINLYVEETPDGPGPDARLPRPGLVEAYEYGSGPVRGLTMFGGALFILSGTTLYRAGVSVGTVAGTGKVRFAQSDTQLVIVAAGSAYLYEGSTLSLIDDTDLPQVIDVAFLAGRFIYAGQSSGRFYWSAVSDAASIDGLAFATAEGSADNIVALAVMGGQLVIFGGDTVEFWDVTGDADLPFQRSGAAAYPRGCAAQFSVVTTDNSVFWVGDDRIIYRGRNVPDRVSNHGVEAALKRCTSISAVTAFEVRSEGHAFYVVNIPGVTTFALDLASPTPPGWAEWTSYGKTTFRCECAILSAGVALAGDNTTGQVFAFTPGIYADDGAVITYLASVWIAHADRPVRFNNLVLQGARGVGLATGQGSDPVTEMRYSNDQGNTWSTWRQATLGKVGEYTRRAVWQQLGLIREPGVIIEIRTTDPVLATMAGVLINQARPHG